ncbi:MAG: UvrD-helicase domain-containing protein [Vicinamibacterales bacterium]|nr:UvrD-helicase domain-containing protein [Vicinamibacterales bacterium]
MSSGLLPFDDGPDVGGLVSAVPASLAPAPPVPAPEDARDQAARRAAVDPRLNVALQASAGTGKTKVLVDRFVNLLSAGVDPANVLAITFTRKAAAEMRDRITATVRLASERGEIPPRRWAELRDRLGDIAISTIDAFCLSLLREFPLEADLDPGFRLADDTEVPRLMDEALDRAIRIGRALATEDEAVALVFRQLRDQRVRQGMAGLLSRRLVAPALLDRFLEGGTPTAEEASRQLVQDLRDAMGRAQGGLAAFLDSGPVTLPFALLRMGLDAHLGAGTAAEAEAVPLPALVAAMRDYMLTQEGEPRRGGFSFRKADFAHDRAYKQHKGLVVELAPDVRDALDRHARAVNHLMAQGVRRLFQIARTEYRRTLEAHAVLDFPDVLERACELLRQMDEFARSRFRLEGRYHHILVDEFQDTSQAQWELVALLIRSWREGAGVADTGPLPPSIFLVGDPKQSIYGFRDADAGILHDAAAFLEGLRPGHHVRQSISRSFRSVPGVLALVNDLCTGMAEENASRDAFRYEEADRFPLDAASLSAVPVVADAPVLGVVAGDTPEACAAGVAAEVQQLLRTGTVRDRETGVARAATAGDIAVLFRSRDSHRAFESALEAVGVRTHVYKGLGFFDSDEVKDVLALLWYLAAPHSNLRAAAWLRSRVVGLSDAALAVLAPGIADAVMGADSAVASRLAPVDRQLFERARHHVRRWRALVDVLPPAELLDRVLDESAYHVELRGPRLQQARENLKKLRSLVRRLQNRGYATLARVVEYIDRLSLGDESNAVIDATDAVNLMTVHASKGLEFPVVFVVNLARGTGNWRDPIRVSAGREDDGPVSVGIGTFQSEADDRRPAREREETKRLLYVALTRARDRVYLGTVVKDGRPQPGRGSLAEVMPQSLLDVLAQAAGGAGAAAAGAANTEPPDLAWVGPSGQAHRFRTCPVHPEPSTAREVLLARAVAEGPPADFARLTAAPGARPVVAAAGSPLAPPARRGAGPGVETGAGRGTETERLVGTAVHRLIERRGLREVTTDEVAAQLPTLLRDDLPPEVAAEPGPLAARVAEACRNLTRQSDLTALLASGEVYHEVPFSARIDGEIRRGVLDCLVRTPDGHVTVVEFKTGRPRPEHAAQIEVYRQAAAVLFPDAEVSARLFHAGAEISPAK